MSEHPRATHAYVGRWPDGRWYGTVVDLPQDRHVTAEYVADMIRDGAVVKRMTLEEARLVPGGDDRAHIDKPAP